MPQKKPTQIFKIDPGNINQISLLRCAEMIREGKLVVFPTETVYGLGGNALDENAAKKIFEAKGRPSDNPLIVHISNDDMLDNLVSSIPDKAKKLMNRFWPGPLTIIMKKKSTVPSATTSGLNTIAVRMPSHQVAFQLIKLAGVPIAAPSANLSGKPSCTLPKHVIEDLKGKVDSIIDGGDCRYGLESTVIDVTGARPTLLRPGAVTLEQLEECIGKVAVANPNAKKPKSPGMKYRHYAPKTPLILILGDTEEERRRKTIDEWNKLIQEKKRVVLIGTKELQQELKHRCKVQIIGTRKDMIGIAHQIFGILREVDKKDYDYILIGACDEVGIGHAIMNRLRKAASITI